MMVDPEEPQRTRKQPWGVVYAAMGGPRHLDEVRPFLQRIFSDPAMIPMSLPDVVRRGLGFAMARLLSPRSRKKYARIGGGSPLVRLTMEQAKALRSELVADSIPVATAFRYCLPSAAQALSALVEEGARQVMVLTGYPQASSVTTGSTMNDLRQAASSLPITLYEAGSYPELEGFLEVSCRNIATGIRRLEKLRAERTALILTAHSVPEKIVSSADPYLDEIERTVSSIAGRFPSIPSWLTFQSRSAGPYQWHGTPPEEKMKEIASQGFDSVVVSPISFICEHLETLYDLDLVLAAHAASTGLLMERAATVGSSPLFIESLAGLVRRRIAEVEKDRERCVAR